MKRHHRRKQAKIAAQNLAQPNHFVSPAPPSPAGPFVSSSLCVKKTPSHEVSPTPSASPRPCVKAPSSIGEADPTIHNSELRIHNCGGSAATPDPAAFLTRFLPHHARQAGNPMHAASFAEYHRQAAEPLPTRNGRRLAIAAPRGAAKSTIHTLLFPLMGLLTQSERHQVIISGTMQQAKNRIATIIHELRNNKAIRDAFFGGKRPQIKSNTRSIEYGNCRIEAFSAGSEMRGISHGEYRPTRIILDDVEQSRAASKSWHRKRLLQWYDEIVENLGDTYTHITIVGTILHTDSLLATLLNRPGYKALRYQSIIQWDKCPELWRQWQRLYTSREDADAADTARAFFHANETAMLEGTKVLWPEKEPYYALQEKLLILGRAAFFKEKQNSPIKDGDQLFDTSLWTRFICDNGHIKILPKDTTIADDTRDYQSDFTDYQDNTLSESPNHEFSPGSADGSSAISNQTISEANPANPSATNPIGPIGPISPIPTHNHEVSPTPPSPDNPFVSLSLCVKTTPHHEVIPTPSAPPRLCVKTPSSIGEADPTIHNCPTTALVDDLKYFAFLDPALGKPTTRDGDYAAIVTVAQAPDQSLYVMNAWLERANINRQIEMLFALHDKFKYQRIGFESNGFQEIINQLIKEEQAKLRRSGKAVRLPIQKVRNQHPKYSRIALLEPPILAGNLHFHADLPHQFYVQADEYNGRPGNHDDALDALASCIDMIHNTTKAPTLLSAIKTLPRPTPRY